MRPGLTLAGLTAGLVIGLTGMGGGALLTPILVLVFGIDPLVAVSNDVIVSLVLKPIGGAVHLKHGDVDRRLVKWLAIGSVPAAFSGVLALHALGGAHHTKTLKTVLGSVLLVAAGAILAKELIRRRSPSETRPALRIAPTIAIGVLGGLMVGLTSVGSGSLMIVLLLALYPRIDSRVLVGTDLVQAIPLVASAAAGHLIFGEFRFGITLPLLLGAIPGVYAGARVSARANNRWLRPVLAFTLLASSLKLLGVSGPAFWCGLVVAAGVVGSAMVRAKSLTPNVALAPATVPPPRVRRDQRRVGVGTTGVEEREQR